MERNDNYFYTQEGPSPAKMDWVTHLEPPQLGCFSDA
jgi:hypothetical protein